MRPLVVTDTPELTATYWPEVGLHYGETHVKFRFHPDRPTLRVMSVCCDSFTTTYNRYAAQHHVGGTEATDYVVCGQCGQVQQTQWEGVQVVDWDLAVAESWLALAHPREDPLLLALVAVEFEQDLASAVELVRPVLQKHYEETFAS